MLKSLRRKWVFISGVLLLCVIGVVGLPKSRQELASNLRRNIRLGLDLKGGSHIVLQIQLQDAFKAEADLVIDRLKEQLARENIPFTAIDRNEPTSIETAETVAISIRGVPAERASDLNRIVTDVAGQWTVTAEASTDYQLNLRRDAAAALRRDTVTQSIATLERKVDALGLAEVAVQQRGGSDGESEILVQLPGVDDPVRIKSILQTAAILELYEVIDGPLASQQAAAAAAEPSGNAKVVRGSSQAGDGTPENWWVVARSPVVTGRDLRTARAEQGEFAGRWDTGFSLRQDAADRFGRFTEAHVGRRLAIVLDNVVLSAPTIQTRISNEGRITGAATQQEAADLALNLRSGALPASVKVIEERTVGASLGADSIRKGVLAGIVGLALVVASMVLYYRGAGWNAVVGLLLNTIMTIAALSYLDATWTLPGIAGLILSIGMAVDSNVLIFERIKEEQRSGKSLRAAIAAGFDRAFTTIVDTHVTTVVASAFLFMFGTGPVRGFAVTLVIGLIANLFTAVFVSRAIFDVHLWRHPRLDRLSIGTELFKATHIDFLSKRRLTLGLSAVAILVSAASLGVKGGPRYGLDFRGGTLMYVKFDPRPPIDDLRNVLSARLSGEFSLQESQDTGEFIVGTALAEEETLEQARITIEQTLRERYTDAGGTPTFDIRSVEMVGPRAGEQLRRQGLYAALGALGGMLIYVAYRFRLVAGTAAVIATVHDVLITLGLFSLTNREIDLTIVAALLTLIGYSMNDKIVVFDRVRENERGLARAKRRGSFEDLVNQSINQTLSRTLLTAGPTLLACLALYFFGGEVLNGIAFALFVGIVVGTYSSIFVARALMVMWRERQLALVPHRA
jgi:protein-export membrane protein SecD/preprotein translocase SecF subunit